MCAKLSALPGVEPTLEERAKDGWLDSRPVEQCGIMHRAQIVGGARNHSGVSEEPAVEPVDALVAEEAAGLGVRHDAEEGGEPAVELLRGGAPRLDHARENARWEQPCVLGEEAEDDAVEVVGDGFRIVSALVHRARDLREARCGQLRNLVGGLLGPQRLGVEHDGAQHAQRLGGAFPARVEVIERHDVNRWPGVGEGGVDLDAIHVADDQQRRIIERVAVVDELLVRRGEVRVRAFVLPGEVPALPDVRPALAAGAEPFRAGLERVRLAGRIGLVRRRHAEQAAEVDEVLLRRGALAARAVAPLGGEGGG